MKALLCRVFGHRPVREQGKIGTRKALASRCRRCSFVLDVRIVPRTEARRMRFGRP